MSRWLAIAVAAAAIGACEKTHQTRASSGASTIEVLTPPADNGKSAGFTPPTSSDRDASVAPEPSHDAAANSMLAEPRCAGLAQTITSNAKWTSQTVIELQLGKPAMPGAEYLTSEPPTVTEGTLKTKRITKDSVVLEIDVAGSNPVYASVSARCARGTQQIDISIGNPTGLLVPGTTPIVWLVDM